MKWSYLLGCKVRVDLEVMTMKGYFTFPRSPEVKFHYQMQSTVISRTPPFGSGSYLSAGDTDNIF